MHILQIVFLLSVCGCPQALSTRISDILDAEWLSIKITKMIDMSDVPRGQKVLLAEFKGYNDYIEEQMDGIGLQVLDTIVAYTDGQFQLKLKLMEAKKNIESIYKYKYKDMATFIENNTVTLEKFERSIASPNNSTLHSKLDRIHAIIERSSVFKILIQYMREKGNKMFCNMQTSAQQLVLHLYNTLALIELKGFLMIGFSYMFLQLNERDATYIEITELFQGYIENVKNLEEFNGTRSCSPKCNSFINTMAYSCNDETMFCSKNRRCMGRAINCHPIADATVCLADEGTNRRYEYIEQARGVLGLKKECANNSVRFEAWFISCQYCMCICDESGFNSDRYFSLRSSESKIDQNMVVTGLRFVKKNRIIHLQIQEGKLLPRAKIDVATVHWKPVEDYRIDDHGVRDGLDYHTLTWEKRAFDLDDLVAKDDELVTGVRFEVIAGHLNFQIRVTPFDFTTGKLEVVKSKWKHYVSSQNRKKINLHNKDIPIRSPGLSLPVSESGKYLKFTHSDLGMDAAQTTVPFIDAQAVAPELPVPLSGAGVTYKGSKNFGGFINTKIMTYDYSKVLRDAYDDTK